MPGRPMRGRGQMAVENGVDLVGAAGGLVHALRIERHHPLGGGEHLIEAADILDLQVGQAAATKAMRRRRDACRRPAPRRSR